MAALRNIVLFIILPLFTFFLFLTDLSIGSVNLPINEVWDILFGKTSNETNYNIVINIRFIKAVTALLAGAALSVSGLQMQTLFRNPLAGPYVLGISSGASLGVAIFILGLPLIGATSDQIPLGIAGAAWIGAGVILLFIGAISQKVKNIMVILILGMMFSSGITAIVQILQYLSHEEALKRFVIWTMGSLGEITFQGLYILAAGTIAGLILSLFTIKPLNQLLLGEDYAVSMGLNIKKSRSLLFLSTTLLAGTVTAFCGPIGFIGLAIPHVCRIMFNSSNHRIVLPSAVFTGASVLLICDIISKIFILPINAITALLGIPVIIWIVMRNKSVAV